MGQRRRYSAEEFDRAWALAYSRHRVERERRDEAAAAANDARSRADTAARVVAYCAATGCDWETGLRHFGVRPNR